MNLDHPNGARPNEEATTSENAEELRDVFSTGRRRHCQVFDVAILNGSLQRGRFTYVAHETFR